MNFVLVAIVIVILLLIVCLISTYNNLINKKHSVENSLSSIDVYLQTRLDLLTNVFEQVDITLDHESKVFSEVTALRSQYNQIKGEYENLQNKSDIVKVDNNMKKFEKQIKVTYERYPELKSIQVVKKAIDTNVSIENNINAARRNYNNNVTMYKNSISTFPNMLFAGLFGFRNSYELYKADEEASNRVSARSIISQE